jgi:predicted SnoaL-like aldol condensation-catalyzing enzyme
MSSPEENKQTVQRLFDAFRAGDVQAFDDLIAADYLQHNPQVPHGLQPVKDYFGSIGPVELDVHHVLADGDLVAAHVHYKTFGMAAVDIWRFGADGKIVEHWDVLQEIPEVTASGNDMFSDLYRG